MNIWELLTACAEKEWYLDGRHVTRHCTEKEKKAMTKEAHFVTVKQGADVDGGQMAEAKALTVKQRRHGFSSQSSRWCMVVYWKDTGEMVPEKDSWQLVQREREGRKHRSEQCNDVGGKCKCVRCGKRSKRAEI